MNYHTFFSPDASSASISVSGTAITKPTSSSSGSSSAVTVTVDLSRKLESKSPDFGELAMTSSSLGHYKE